MKRVAFREVTYRVRGVVTLPSGQRVVVVERRQPRQRRVVYNDPLDALWARSGGLKFGR